MEQSIPDIPTRDRLIQAGLHLFGHKGFEGTSTREVAAHAGTNVASIAYHFDGKAGLRIACARTVAERVNGVMEASGVAPETLAPPAALTLVEQMIRAFIQLILGSAQARDMVAFMLRELTDPGEVADIVYIEFIEPRHKALSALWARATGRKPEDEELKLAIFAMLGQILYFHVARPFVERRMDWDGIGPTETRKIADLVIATLRATIERLSA